MPVILLVLILGYLLGRLHHARRVIFLTRRVRELTQQSDDLVTDGHVRDARYTALLDRYDRLSCQWYDVWRQREHVKTLLDESRNMTVALLERGH
jgi:hypothetical protein